MAALLDRPSRPEPFAGGIGDRCCDTGRVTAADPVDRRDLEADARWFEYSRAADPVGSGRVAPIPLARFDAKTHRDLVTGIVPFDLRDELRLDEHTAAGPTTSPALVASFIRIAPGDHVDTAPVATSELYFVLDGSGASTVTDRSGRVFDLAWGVGDVVVLPAGCSSHHVGVDDATLYWVTDEPLLRYLGVTPNATRFAPTRFAAERTRSELDDVANAPHALDRNRLSVLLNTAPNDQTQTITHVLWAMFGLLPAGAAQRPHRHQSVALDLIVDCPPGCYTLVGRSVDDRGEIVRPTRIDWEAGGAFVTPPGMWHAHYNESDVDAHLLPIQDAGIHTHLRSLDIRFVGPRRR